MSGTIGGRSRLASRVPLRRLPSPLPSATFDASCLSESWRTNGEDLTGEDLSWTVDKFCQAFPSDGSTSLFNYTSSSHGLYDGALHVVSNTLALAKPSVGPLSADGAYDSPYWGYMSGNAQLNNVLPSQNIAVSFTLTGAPPTQADGIGSRIATNGFRSWGTSPYLRFDPDSFDGWQLFMGNIGTTGDDFSVFLTILWRGGVAFFDALEPYAVSTIPPFETGEDIRFAVTGVEDSTRVTVERNGVVIVDLSGTTLSDANGGDFSGLPSGSGANLFLYAQGAATSDDAGPTHSPHYPFFGPITDAMNDQVSIDDVRFCVA